MRPQLARSGWLGAQRSRGTLIMLKELKKIEAKVKRGWVHPAIGKHLEHNKKVRESRKQTMESDLGELVSDKVNHHFNVKRGRLMSLPPNIRLITVKKHLCFICGEHDVQMMTGRYIGRFYCNEHRGARYCPSMEQDKIRSEYHVKKQNRTECVGAV